MTRTLSIQGLCLKHQQRTLVDQLDLTLKAGEVHALVGASGSGKSLSCLGILDLLRGRAFDKRIALPAKTPVDLTLDTSLNFDELLAAWRGWFEGQKPTAETRSGPVQP